VAEFLQNLGRCDERVAVYRGAIERLSGHTLQRVLPADRIHEDIRVYEDQTSGNPLLRDLFITAKCSSQSGSRPGPARASHHSQKARISSTDLNFSCF
jgi:hypothetical protein